MQATTRTIETDVCIVGAGIVGLAHAYEARRRGLNVVVIDRDDRAVGASVRTSGHLFFASVGADALGCAERSRERWLEVGRRARMFVEEGGTLIVARHRDELAVLEAVAHDPVRHARMLSAREVGQLAPIPISELVGGFHATGDLRIDPRTAVARIANLLAQDGGARLEWGTHVDEIEDGRVLAGRLQVRAPAIVVCPGPDYRALSPVLRRGLTEMTRGQLQMLRLAAPTAKRYKPALLTGLSLIRYPVFASEPSAAELRARVELEKSELVERGIHLLVTQLPDGDLIVGETHAYDDTVSPFGNEHLYRLLLNEARLLLGIEPEVRQRWLGVHPTLRVPGPRNFLVTAPLPGVRVVEDVAGTGMALSFGKAPEVLDELLANQHPGAMSPRVTAHPTSATARLAARA